MIAKLGEHVEICQSNMGNGPLTFLCMHAIASRMVLRLRVSAVFAFSI